MIPYGRQSIDEDDIDAVVEVLRGDFLTQGPAVPCFEADLAKLFNARHVVAANSATSALHSAYAALGCGPGKRVWTVPITFVATANAALMCGAEVGFVDVDPVTGCLDVTDLECRLVQAKAKGKLPDIVTPVHMTGRPCDMPAIGTLAKEYGFRVLEDAAHAVGAQEDAARSARVGACRYSDIAVFSFHPVKIVTTGEGGAAATNDPELEASLRRFISHGITRDQALMTKPSEGSWYYQQIELGCNYRMTDIQAALGSAQLKKLPAFLARRRELVRRYDDKLRGLPVTRPPLDMVGNAAWHLYVIHLEDRAKRAVVFEELRARGIGVQIHYIPVHLQPFYTARGFKAGDFPGAEAYYAGAISLPLFASLSDADQDAVVATLADILATV